MVDPRLVLEKFRGLLSQDSAVREDAEQFILEMMNLHRDEGLIACSEIILHEGLESRDYASAIIYMKQMLDPVNGNVANMWDSFRKRKEIPFKEPILRAALHALIMPESEISMTAAIVLGSVAALDRGCFEEIRLVMDILADGEVHKRYAACQAFKCIFEVYNNPNAREFNPNDKIMLVFYDFVECSLHIIRNFRMFDQQLVAGVFVALAEFMKMKDKITGTSYYTFDGSQPPRIKYAGRPIQEVDEVMQRWKSEPPVDLRGDLFSSIADILRACGSKEVVENVYAFMFAFFIANYHPDQLPMELIWGASSETVMHGNPEFASIAISFWNDVADYEREIMKHNAIIDRYEEAMKYHNKEIKTSRMQKRKVFLNVTGVALGQLIGNILLTMTRVNEEDVSAEVVEEIDDQNTHAFATSCLRKYLSFNAKAVFDAIVDVWKTGFDQPWNVQHAMLLMIDCLCSCPGNPHILEFLTSIAPVLLDAARSPLPRLSATALSTIASVQAYGIPITPEDVGMMLEMVKDRIETNDEVVARCALHVLIATVSRFSPDDKQSPLPDLYPPIDSLLGMVLERYTGNLIDTAYNLVEKLVILTPPDRAENVATLYRRTIERPICPSQLSLIAALFRRFGSVLVQFGPEAAAFLEHVMSAKDINYESALSALIELVIALKNDAVHLVGHVTTAVGESLSSGNTSIVVTTIQLLGSLLETLGDPTPEFIGATFGHLDQLFGNREFMFVSRSNHPVLAISLGKIALGTSKLVDPSLRNHILSLFKHLIATHIETRTSDDVTLTNDFYEGIFSGYSDMVKAWADDKPYMIRNKGVFFDPITRLVNLKLPFYTDNMLRGLCEFLQCAHEVMGSIQRCKIVLANEANLEMLLWAESQGNESLACLAMRVWKLLTGK